MVLKLSIKILKDYEVRGLLYSQKHPTLPLCIWNYTDKVQYESLWDEVTLLCRALVTDDNGKIVARPFKKFFNLSEGKTTIFDEYEIYEKLDGSLGILFYYNDSWVFASRGSFTSEQAIKGKELLETVSDYSKFNKEYTYCFEIIYKSNRIVCDYGDFEGVILTGVFETETGREKSLAEVYFPSIVKTFDSKTPLKELNTEIKDNEEGYVVRFSNGERCKIKGDEYLRLHRIMTAVSTTSIWECLKNGDDLMLLLKDVPNEFYNKVDAFIEQLQSQYILTDAKYKAIFISINNNDKKQFALDALKYPLSGILFNMYNSKDYSEVIWKAIKPKFERI